MLLLACKLHSLIMWHSHWKWNLHPICIWQYYLCYAIHVYGTMVYRVIYIPHVHCRPKYKLYSAGFWHFRFEICKLHATDAWHYDVKCNLLSTSIWHVYDKYRSDYLLYSMTCNEVMQTEGVKIPALNGMNRTRSFYPVTIETYVVNLNAYFTRCYTRDSESLTGVGGLRRETDSEMAGDN